MRTLSELLNLKPVYLNDWRSKTDVIGDFECGWLDKEEIRELSNSKYADINILFASYGTDNYSGDAFVLFEQDGNLYEVNGGHCSCHGLENQWEPEETTIECLVHRLRKGELGKDNYAGNLFHQELKEFLGV